jgi:hypothetical protein
MPDKTCDPSSDLDANELADDGLLDASGTLMATRAVIPWTPGEPGGATGG